MSLKGFFLIILIPFMVGIMSIFGGAQGTSVVLLNNQKGKIFFLLHFIMLYWPRYFEWGERGKHKVCAGGPGIIKHPCFHVWPRARTWQTHLLVSAVLQFRAPHFVIFSSICNVTRMRNSFSIYIRNRPKLLPPEAKTNWISGDNESFSPA